MSAAPAYDPRTARSVPETLDASQQLERSPDFRADLERIRFSPYFSRLSAVTQVISQTGAGMAIHNRLTHSLKVAAVARAIAVGLSAEGGRAGELLESLGAATRRWSRPRPAPMMWGTRPSAIWGVGAGPPGSRTFRPG
ncbi:hypothetical protein [Nesterenkonia pannonica]|uniref:hypothetical protein n=1 Tax=Nesterenkonia pannonica TaxID=1548602 RepID=UPI0021645E48|nr:hypothetical protein [Nesterenkonia pannonica]